MKLIVIIPAYNEVKTIGSVLANIPLDVSGISEQEVVVIDDGSHDGTKEVAQQGGATVVSHAENRGLGKAFESGVKEALVRQGDVMVVLDADNQFDANDIPRLIRPIIEGVADFVSATRFTKESSVVNIPRYRVIGNKFMVIFLNFVSGRRFSDVSCGFRAYSREALLSLNLFGTFTYTQEVLLNLHFKGLRLKEVPVKVVYFSGRKSHISGSIKRYVLQTFKIIFRTVLDYRPLSIFGGMGVLLFGAGTIFDIVMMLIYFQTGQFSPYISVGATGIVLNMFGLFLLVIGLIADMLNRIRHNQERILYLAKKQMYGRERRF